jgi:hypothetical protein
MTTQTPGQGYHRDAEGGRKMSVPPAAAARAFQTFAPRPANCSQAGRGELLRQANLTLEVLRCEMRLAHDLQEKPNSCRVALGGYPPRAPTDPDVPN